MSVIRFARLSNYARQPTRATEGSVGWDLYAATDMSHCYIPPGRTVKIPTGIAVEIPPSVVAMILGRSSWAGDGVLVHPGLPDWDYRGELHVVACNTGRDTFTFDRDDRIGQLVLYRAVRAPTFEEVDEDDLTKTARGAGGFGSTGD